MSFLVFVSHDFELARKLRCDLQKVFASDLIEIWYVCRDTPCGLIQCHGRGHVALKVKNSSIFKIYLVRHFQWELASDC